jgi:hypothetical protein
VIFVDIFGFLSGKHWKNIHKTMKIPEKNEKNNKKQSKTLENIKFFAQ